MKKALFGGVGTPVKVRAKTRLEYLREQIEKECISYGEIAELQSLAQYIEAGDVVLLELAGVEENLSARQLMEKSAKDIGFIS